MSNRWSKHPSRRLWLVLSAALLAGGSGAGLAGDEHDHDRARQALEAGEVLPLRSILERVEREQPGQVVDVELERDRDGERWVYKIKLLRSGGALVKLKVDARDGRLLGQKNADRHIEPNRPDGQRPGDGR